LCLLHLLQFHFHTKLPMRWELFGSNQKLNYKNFHLLQNSLQANVYYLVLNME